MTYISIDIDIDDVLYGLTAREKQRLVDDLYDDGYTAKKDPRYGLPEFDDWDEKVAKLLYNKWRLSKEDEETILKIVSKII